MKVKHFLSRVQHDRVHYAIQHAEKGTSADIVVYISHHRIHDALAAAHEAFRKLKLETPEVRNSLLFFIAPKQQTFAVVGGTALHEKVGQEWWDDLTKILATHFRDGRYTEGLIAALQEAGSTLRLHFPDTTTDRTGQRDIVED